MTTATQPSLSAPRMGDVHFWSRTLIPTTREAPNDAEIPSHVLLHRAGFIRQVGAGIYDYLPLAWRTLQRISDIVRSELNAAGASELLMPALEPFELFNGTRRHETYGDNLFRVTDRKGRLNALAPTHEEVITQLMIGCISSPKQLPLNLYQIQTKFRDEARPRAGLLRCREFIMKDAYSFHMHLEGAGGLNETYDKMFTAYSNIFRRCGLDFTAVEAESGPIGGSASHEFMVNCDSGEDTVLKCPVSGYAANVEKCEIGPRPTGTLTEAPSGDLTEVHTPNLPGIDEVGKFMKVKPDRMLKTIVFIAPPEKEGGPTRWIVAVVRGDHEVNEGKVKALAGVSSVELAPVEAAKAAGFAVGYVSPRVVNTVANVTLLIDADASGGGFWASGADKPDHHVKHFNWRREVGAVLDDRLKVKVGDVRNALEGDPSPRADAKLVTGRGIEVGHIFKLGTKYSDAMGLSILNAAQQKQSVIMGCYGVGVSRTMAAAVEQNHDDNGILWPAAIAPYHVHMVVIKPEEDGTLDRARSLAAELAARGLDVLVDDRDERPGPKFKDADLVGIPVHLTVSPKSLGEGSAEFKLRADPGKGELVSLAQVVDRAEAAVLTLIGG
jgi:prolyl-tRNA synthetase